MHMVTESKCPLRVNPSLSWAQDEFDGFELAIMLNCDTCATEIWLCSNSVIARLLLIFDSRRPT